MRSGDLKERSDQAISWFFSEAARDLTIAEARQYIREHFGEDVEMVLDWRRDGN